MGVLGFWDTIFFKQPPMRVDPPNLGPKTND
jgi:hypothetical protein